MYAFEKWYCCNPEEESSLYVSMSAKILYSAKNCLKVWEMLMANETFDEGNDDVSKVLSNSRQR
jgi:hypothetical protein